MDKQKLKQIDGNELKLKPEDEKTIIFEGKEIERNELSGTDYLEKIEKEIGFKLKACINCANFELTALSRNMANSYNGKCSFWEKKLEGKALQRDYHFSIFHLCEHFKFFPLKERDKQGE